MIGVVAHDAGGAEVISSYLRQNSLGCVFCLEGPARAVFGRKLGVLDSLPLAELIALSDSVMCGTSFLSDLEWRAMGLARAAGKPSVAVLDHWVGYRDRFVRRGEEHLPDEVWVGDEIAEGLSRRELPGVTARLVPNPYFIDIQRELASMTAKGPDGNGLRILFVSEPLREDGIALYGDERYWGYTEEEALRYFLSNVHVIGRDIAQIVIRRHPQEEPGKYDWAAREFSLPIVSDEDRSLLEQIVACDVVVGCATMAMVVGLLANKRVVSCIPPGGRAVPLPHAEIEPLATVVAVNGRESIGGRSNA